MKNSMENVTMKQFATILILSILMCLCLAGCSDFSMYSDVDDGLPGDVQEVFAVVDADATELEASDEDSESTSDGETDFNDLFDNLFEETHVQQEEDLVTDEQTASNTTDSQTELEADVLEETAISEQAKPSSIKGDDTQEEQAVTEKEPEVQSQQAESVEKTVPVQSEQNNVQQQSSSQTPVQSTSTVLGGVWIPQSGKKYQSHSGCSNMNNPTNVTLEQAQSLGYTACKRCY